MTFSQQMMGSFPLTAEGVARHVTTGGPGAYALGFTTGDLFTVQFVGRADENLAEALAAHAAARRYAKFKALPLPSAHDAFEKECDLFHQFGGLRHLDNTAHPARPGAVSWKCPHCTIYGIRDWSAAAR